VDVENKTKVAGVFEDPRAQSIAQVYAIAYLDAAAANVAGAVEELTSFVVDVLGSQSDFDSLLRGTSISQDEK